MKTKLTVSMSIMAILCPLISVLIAFQVDGEFIENLIFSILVGSILGSFFGFLAMITNRKKYKWISIISVIPMIPFFIFLFLAIPYFLYN